MSPSPGMRGWYVELDAELVRMFEEIFPEHGAKTVLTARAVIQAIQDRKMPTVQLDPELEAKIWTDFTNPRRG